MCGRFTQRTPKERVAREFELQQIPDIEARYNIALTQNISAVRQMADEREAVMLKGGLILMGERRFDECQGQAVRERWPHRFGRATGRLRKINHEVLVVKDGRRYFVANDTKLSSSALKRHYRFRQQVEEVFRWTRPRTSASSTLSGREEDAVN